MTTTPSLRTLITDDPDFFRLFTYEAVEGNLETALKEPMAIVLEESLAKKLFGNEQALGKTLKNNNKHTLTVSAVVKTLKANSSLSFSSITSNANRKIVYLNGGEFKEWGYWNFNLFVLLKEVANSNETATSVSSMWGKPLSLTLSFFGKVFVVFVRETHAKPITCVTKYRNE